MGKNGTNLKKKLPSRKKKTPEKIDNYNNGIYKKSS